MSIIVKVGAAETRLSDLLARVEAGEEVIIARGNEPIAKLTRSAGGARRRAARAALKAERARAKPVTTEEVLAPAGRPAGGDRHGAAGERGWARQLWS